MPKKHFKFNQAQCCLNPEKEIFFDNGTFYVAIYLARKGAFWAYGYDYILSSCGGGGCSGACFGEPRTKFESPSEARRAALQEISQYFNEPKHQPVSDLIKKELTQLSLFENASL